MFIAGVQVAHDSEQGAKIPHKLVLAALGVVFGDIGTSPLYSLTECFHGHDLAPTDHNVFGVLSLIVWTLLLTITLKYVALVLRADNHGEGGILALMSLIRPHGATEPWTPGWVFVLMGLFGAALLFGEGVITPAVSVLSAVEGFNQITPAFSHFAVPITLCILFVLFRSQFFGTAKVGLVFGPIMMLWFLTIGGLGAYHIFETPSVLYALNPYYGLEFLLTGRWQAFFVLGGVFLCTTGGEALYADLGHFGRFPIRLAWFTVVLPALLLNYFGQGAMLLSHPDVSHPFFSLAPPDLLLPLVLLATLATVIASQALISGTFSITQQAIQLGYLPRLPIAHTSAKDIGQIYVGFVNWSLFIGCIFVVLLFQTSSALVGAYGVAVSITTTITTVFAYTLTRYRWGWSRKRAFAVWGLFAIIDLSFATANFSKIMDGGWFPLIMGLVLFTIMTTWAAGRRVLGRRMFELAMGLDEFRKMVETEKPARVPGVAIFMTSNTSRVPPALLRNLTYNHVVHETIVLLNVVTKDIPHVSPGDRVEVSDLGGNYWRVTLNYGFMQTPDVPHDLASLEYPGLDLDPHNITYVLGRETVIATDRPGIAIWRERLFAIMRTNAQPATAFYKLPADAVVEIGAQIEI